MVNTLFNRCWLGGELSEEYSKGARDVNKGKKTARNG